jgi:hypothetical protein
MAEIFHYPLESLLLAQTETGAEKRIKPTVIDEQRLATEL